MKPGNNGVTSKTKDNIVFGAGTIHVGLKNSGTWNFEASCIGATKGGSKFSVKPNIHSIEPDGVTVKLKGFDKKVGETATLEINLLELTEDMVKRATFAKTNMEPTVEGYDHLISKPDIEAGDYLENVAFVGELLNGTQIIVILDNALCTSGLENDGKNNEENAWKFTLECTADPDKTVDTLPWHIYYPTSKGKTLQAQETKTAPKNA